MQRVKVKICGLQEEAHMIAAAEAGADYVGLVFADSRRKITPERAECLRHVLDEMPARPAVVGVFVDESPHLVNVMAERCRLDLVQLSGDESPDYCAMVVAPIVKTVRVFPWTTVMDVNERISALESAETLHPISFLLDTGSTRLPGGTGRSFDWRIAHEVSKTHPVLVAGGLDAACVADLVSLVRPYGVDVSSGVERDGRKDQSLMMAFMQAVRKAEQEINNAEDTAS